MLSGSLSKNVVETFADSAQDSWLNCTLSSSDNLTVLGPYLLWNYSVLNYENQYYVPLSNLKSTQGFIKFSAQSSIIQYHNNSSSHVVQNYMNMISVVAPFGSELSYVSGCAIKAASK